MDLRFDSHDIEAWARLSGDRNPIHFDREAALRMNAADVVVHGMLAMLPIKQAHHIQSTLHSTLLHLSLYP